MQQFFEFMVNNWLLFLALVVIIALLVLSSVRGRLLGFGELKPTEAVELMNREEPLLLDVREADEYKDGHILGVVHIPVTELEGRIKEVEAWREKPVLIICRTGQRSAKAASALKRQGFTQLHKLDGGMMAWQSANLPLSR